METRKALQEILYVFVARENENLTIALSFRQVALLESCPAPWRRSFTDGALTGTTCLLYA